MNAMIQPRTSATAVASLFFGIITWFALPFVGAVVAVICGHSARGEIARSGGSLDGGGLALTGLLLGWIHLALFLVIFLFLLSLPLGLLGIFEGIGHFLHSLPGCGTAAGTIAT